MLSIPLPTCARGAFLQCYAQRYGLSKTAARAGKLNNRCSHTDAGRSGAAYRASLRARLMASFLAVNTADLRTRLWGGANGLALAGVCCAPSTHGSKD